MPRDLAQTFHRSSFEEQTPSSVQQSAYAFIRALKAESLWSLLKAHSYKVCRLLQRCLHKAEVRFRSRKSTPVQKQQDFSGTISPLDSGCDQWMASTDTCFVRLWEDTKKAPSHQLEYYEFQRFKLIHCTVKCCG